MQSVASEGLHVGGHFGILLGTVLLLCGMADCDAQQVDFQNDILPILSDRCFACHGPDAASREADLRLDTPAGAMAELGGGGHAIVPGSPAESVLLQRIRSAEESMRMPPVESNLTVSAREADLLERWISQGATFSQHWAFVPVPELVPLPRVSDNTWPSSPIDRFVLARLDSEKLRPSPPAEKLTWLRRVTFDLSGLPPTPDEIDRFIADNSPSAYETVVDRLLASPHFGERMATVWLDVARYADSYGYQSDLLSPTWPWRDWVVRALNDNLPFDQFITWQLAGDLLPAPTRDQRLATAFNRLHRMTNEGGSISEEYRLEYAADRVGTLGTAVLGLTLECARCHDHKFDPLTQREFYQLTAFFDNIDEWGTYSDSDRVPTPSMLLPSPGEQQSLDQLQTELQSANHDLQQAMQSGEDRFTRWLRDAPAIDTLVPGLVGHYPLDDIQPGRVLENLADPQAPGSTAVSNKLVPGRIGNALELAGDEAVQFPKVCGALRPDEQFTVAMWVRIPNDAADGLIFHRSGGTDVGYHGTEVRIRNGRIFFAMIRFWPGNAIAVESADPLPKGEWLHLAVTYDASVSAGGMHIFVNGQQVESVVRDNLYKMPGQTGDGLTFGERFRDQTIRKLMIDEVRAYARPLTSIEISHLHDGHSLEETLRQRRDVERLKEYYFANFDAEISDARRARNKKAADLLAQRTGLQEIMVMEELPEPRETHLLQRGAYDAPRSDETRVDSAVPALLGSLPKGSDGNRLALAHWLTDPSHPLTARVAVNRYWQIFFGRGLVETAEDFGTQGSPPSHPRLLDWLARDFVNHGWDTKRLCRQIVLSTTYRQASTSDSRQQDPRNVLLARGPSRRLPAEMIRDAALSASGLLNGKLGGPPASPYQPANLWTESNSMSPAYKQSVGSELYRRSLYTVVKRTAPAPSMTAFDTPSREVCLARRSTTNTPLQALVLLNDIQWVEAARVLAERMIRDGAPSDETRIDYGFVLVTGRHPTSSERDLLEKLLLQQREQFEQHPERARELVGLGSHPVDKSLPATEVAATCIVAQTILNLDAAVWNR